MRNTEKNYVKALEKLAKNIKKARLKNKLRQADMIDYGFSERYIQKLESGQYSPNLYTVHRLAEAFSLELHELFK